jgi:nuclear pore complex protein Nup133
LTALDDAGAVEVIMSTFGERVQERPQLHELLRRGFEQLLKHQVVEPTTLIDILTLMDHVHSEDVLDDICGQEFLMALAVLDASDLSGSIGQPNGDGDIMARLIWKRLFVFDDWKKINQTTGKSDNQVQKLLMNTGLFVTLKEGKSQCKLKPSPLLHADYRANEHLAILDSSPAYTIRHPADIIGAGSSASDFDHRFSEADLRAGFVKANSKDDKSLQENLTAARLDYWFDTVKDLALQTAEEEAEMLAAQAERFRQFQEEYVPPEIEPEVPEEPEDTPIVEEEDELVLNGVEEYGEGDTEEDEHLMSGGRGYLVDDEDVEMAE